MLSGAARLATGVTLPFVAQGDRTGRAVLLLHPWGESLRCFDRLRPLLPADLLVLAMDQRGHGDADKPSVGYDLSSSARDVVAFMDATGVQRAVLVGSSSGGYVAQQVAVDHPDRVAALVLVGAPRTLHGRPAFADEVERLTDPVDPAWVRGSLAWFPLHHEVPGWYVEDRVRDGVRLPARVWRDALTGLTAADPPSETGTVTAPTLIVAGDRDEVVPPPEQRALAAAIPGAQLRCYEDTGHLVLWEQPERVAADLVRFVRGLPPPLPPHRVT